MEIFQPLHAGFYARQYHHIFLIKSHHQPTANILEFKALTVSCCDDRCICVNLTIDSVDDSWPGEIF